MAQSDSVRVYVSNTAPWRDKALRFLEGHGIKYEERNVVANHEAMSELIMLTGQQRIPTLARGQAFAAGFDEAAWEELLGR
jgi:glutaredoxin 3